VTTLTAVTSRAAAQLVGEVDPQYDPEVIAYIYTGLGHFVGMRWAEWTAGGRVPDDVFEDLIDVLARGLPPVSSAGPRPSSQPDQDVGQPLSTRQAGAWQRWQP